MPSGLSASGNLARIDIKRIFCTSLTRVSELTGALPDPVIREATHISSSNQSSPMFINFWRKYKIQYISIKSYKYIDVWIYHIRIYTGQEYIALQLWLFVKNYPMFCRLFLTKSAFLWGKLWKNWNCAVIFCHGRVLKGEITSPIYLSPTQAVQGDNPIVKK